MAKSPLGNFPKIISSALYVGFGLVALAVLYQAVFVNTEQRSKAAETEVTYKHWKFNRPNQQGTEGWEGMGATLSVGKGSLNVLAQTSGTKYMVYKFSEPMRLPLGNKTVRLDLKLSPLKVQPIPIGIKEEPVQQEANAQNNNSVSEVARPGGGEQYWSVCMLPVIKDRPDWCPPSLKGSPTPTCRPRPSCLDNPPYCRIPVTSDMCPPHVKPTPKPTPTEKAVYTFGISYTTSTGGLTKATPFSVTADGRKHPLSVSLSDIGEVSITSLQIGFGDVPVDAKILIDEIRLVGPKIKKNACVTPPIGCLSKQSDGSVIMCDSPPGVTYCKPSPTTYPTPTCISLPACIYYNPPCSINIPPPPPGSQYCPKPSPKPGCYYLDVVCVQEPCNPVMVCPDPTGNTTPIQIPSPESGVVCTQETKVCPDGKTWVGRTGQKCEFAPCPVQ